MRENCLGYLEDIISLLMVTHGANGSRRDQTQTNTANAMSLVADKDTHITNFALNQTLYPDGQTDVNTEIEKRVDSLRSKEIRILIAGLYGFVFSFIFYLNDLQMRYSYGVC